MANMKKLPILLTLTLSLLPLRAFAEAVNPSLRSSSLIISEIYTGSPTNASDEYVVVTNAGGGAVDIRGLSLEYKSATGKSWYHKADVADSRQLDGYANLTLASVRAHDYALVDGLAQAGGNLRLVAGDGTVLDQVGWGSADAAEGRPAPAPRFGEALSRICDDDARVCQDSNDNQADFTVLNVDQPIVPSATAATTLTSSGASQAVDQEAALEITELFPDPAKPQTDAQDEFVELYNAETQAVILNGWQLTDAGGHVTKLDGQQIPAGGYLALFAPQTKLSLNNDGDTVSLVAPSGAVVMTTPNYGKSQSGKSFGVTPSGWGWLTTPTPGSVNAGLATDQGGSTSAASKAKKANAKSASSKRSSAAKTPKLAKTAAASNSSGSTDGVADGRSSTVPWPWLLAGLGVLGVGYGAYEYRPEILSFFTKLRAKLGAGK